MCSSRGRAFLTLLTGAHTFQLTPMSHGSSTASRRGVFLATYSSKQAFNVETAVQLSGFAFEAYNSPSERAARWEQGADGCNVAFMSDGFARNCYAGILEVRLLGVKGLPPPTEFTQAVLSGGRSDPYVVFALNEEAPSGPKEGAVALVRAVDRARSSTRWSREAGARGAWRGSGGEDDKGAASWGEGESFYLYVKEPSRAQLALTVFDEDVLKDDEPLGAATVPLDSLGSLISDGGDTMARRAWAGWVPLTWRPETTRDNTVAVGAVAGAFVAGPLGAAAGGFLGSLLKKPVQGAVSLELRYEPLDEGSAAVAIMMAANAAPATVAPATATAEATATPVLASAAPIGATAGLNWSELLRRVRAASDPGATTIDAGVGVELLCFVDNRKTSTQAALWRDETRKRLVLSFRGTNDVKDVLTDVNLLQTALLPREDGKRSDDERAVHAGFFAGARGVNRRLKELVFAACAGRPEQWELLLTVSYCSRARYRYITLTATLLTGPFTWRCARDADRLRLCRGN